ncbi:MAG TPA: peptidylprolyl isomerase, partial [Flavobacteriaceae bacterium]|nr:peptidylprolyl isomerase [Flavobacteriaceae bacterium]
GTFVAELFYKATPITVANFVSLAEGNNQMVDSSYNGKKFFNGLTFHRVIKDFMIQGGDPQGTGQGGPGYKFPDEFNDTLVHDTKGILSMANAGPGTNGSQFFITLKETPFLNNKHSVFGEIVSGQEIVDSIGSVKTAQRDKPVEDVVMQEVNIIRKGDDAKSFDAPMVFKQELDKVEQRKEDEKAALEKELENLSEGYEKTDSGLRYKITETNEDGESPTRGQLAEVHYTGMLTNGKKFDSSYDRDQPIKFPIGVGKVIPGWDEGLMLLKTGEKARLVIPPHLGYGGRDYGPIPANSILIFDVELISVGK